MIPLKINLHVIIHIDQTQSKPSNKLLITMVFQESRLHSTLQQYIDLINLYISHVTKKEEEKDGMKNWLGKAMHTYHYGDYQAGIYPSILVHIIVE